MASRTLAPFQGLQHFMSFMLHSMYTLSLRPFFYGALIGLVIAVALFFTVPAYHNFIVWQFQHPIVILLGFITGITFAIVTD